MASPHSHRRQGLVVDSSGHYKHYRICLPGRWWLGGHVLSPLQCLPLKLYKLRIEHKIKV